MTPEEVEKAMWVLLQSNAPEILISAARVLFANGWTLDDVGALALAIASKAEVYSTQEEAEKALAEDAMKEKPRRMN